MLYIFGESCNIDKVGPSGKFIEFEKDENDDYQFSTKELHFYQTNALFCETLTLRMKIDALYNMKKYLKKHIENEINSETDGFRYDIEQIKNHEYGSELEKMEMKIKAMLDSLEDSEASSE